jgi:uncharacterized membrane protein YtjA (UPF0391 family)
MMRWLLAFAVIVAATIGFGGVVGTRGTMASAGQIVFAVLAITVFFLLASHVASAAPTLKRNVRDRRIADRPFKKSKPKHRS